MDFRLFNDEDIILQFEDLCKNDVSKASELFLKFIDCLLTEIKDLKVKNKLLVRTKMNYEEEEENLINEINELKRVTEEQNKLFRKMKKEENNTKLMVEDLKLNEIVLNKRVDDLNKDKAKLVKDLNKMGNKLNTANPINEQLNEHIDEKLYERDEKIKDLKLNEIVLKKRVDGLNKDKAKLVKDLNKMTNKLDTISNKNSQLTEQMKDEKYDEKKYKIEIKELERDKIDLNNEILVVNYISKQNELIKSNCNYHFSNKNVNQKAFSDFRENFDYGKYL